MSMPPTPGRKSPWKSRKWWSAVIITVIMLINYYTGLDLDIEQLLVVVLPLIAWIIGESWVDAAKKKE